MLIILVSYEFGTRLLFSVKQRGIREVILDFVNLREKSLSGDYHSKHGLLADRCEFAGEENFAS